MSVASILGSLPATLQPQLLPQSNPAPEPYEKPFGQLYGNMGDGTTNIATLYTVPFDFQGTPYQISLINGGLTIQIERNGVYAISYSIVVQTFNNVAENEVKAGLFLNGNTEPYNPSVSNILYPRFDDLPTPPAGTVKYTLTNTCLVELATNDTIELKVLGNNGGSEIVTVVATGVAPFETIFGVNLSIHSTTDAQ